MDLLEAKILERQVEAWDLRLDDFALEKLIGYATYLKNYREANVVGTQDLSRLLIEHVLDSLSCLLCEQVWRAEKLVDVGSGGGLPGIPLKIVRPELGLTLVEATGKKARFLELAAGELSLNRTEIMNVRAEEIGQDPVQRGGHDVATARALAPLAVLSEYCVPLVKKGGCLVAMKAVPDSRELEAGRRAAEILGAEISELVEVEFLPELSAKQRTLVVVTKVSETPRKYPRRIGVPKKSPLGGV